MAYCRQCQIGTVDERGLCVLCGAGQTPETRAQRLAGAGASLVQAAMSPAVALAALVVALGALAGIVGSMARRGGAFAHAPVLPVIGPHTATQGGIGVVSALLAPIIVQTVVLFVALLVLFLLARRRRPRPA